MNTKDNSDIESSSDEDDHDLVMPPPIKKASFETDMEIDVSDDMNDGLLHHLPRHLLNSTYESSLLYKRNKQISEQRTQPANKKSRKSAGRNRKKGAGLRPTLKILEASAVPEE